MHPFKKTRTRSRKKNCPRKQAFDQESVQENDQEKYRFFFPFCVSSYFTFFFYKFPSPGSLDLAVSSSLALWSSSSQALQLFFPLRSCEIVQEAVGRESWPAGHPGHQPQRPRCLWGERVNIQNMCRKRRQLYWYTTLCPIYFFLGFLSQTAGRQVWKKILFSEKMSLVVPPNFQHILRVLNTNIEGKVNIMFALTSIKVSYVLANFFYQHVSDSKILIALPLCKLRIYSLRNSLKSSKGLTKSSLNHTE